MQGNPVQKRTQNAFLLGMLIMLVVSVIIGAVVYFVLIKPEMEEETKTTKKEEQEQVEGKLVDVYILNQDVKSGDNINFGMVDTVKIEETMVAEDYMGTHQTAMLDTYKSKIDLKAGTILTESMLYEGEKTSDSLRMVELNMITPTTRLVIGEYIDVRLTMPTGQDYIVLSKKRIMSINELTIGLYLTEEEILTVNSAIVECYMTNDATNLYITKYVEPGVQATAIPTYPVNAAVLTLIDENPNIIQTIKDTIKARYSVQQRNYVDAQLSQYAQDQLSNVSQKVSEQKEKSREQYLESIGGR